MKRAFVLAVSTVVAVFGAACLAHAPAWSVWVWGGLVALAVGLPRVTGIGGAVCGLIATLAYRATDVYSESALESVFLPLVALLFASLALVACVIRTPELGKQIDHGSLGTGY